MTPWIRLGENSVPCRTIGRMVHEALAGLKTRHAVANSNSPANSMAAASLLCKLGSFNGFLIKNR